jgi:DNA/RNA endonuclease YhcR with UshA esterase domain
VNKKVVAALLAGLTLGVILTFVLTNKAVSPRVKQSFLTPAQVVNHLDQIETVRYTVRFTHVDYSGTEFLDQFQNYRSGFVVTIFRSSLQNYLTDPATTYLGETIDVRGYVQQYDGYYEILNPISISAVP